MMSSLSPSFIIKFNLEGVVLKNGYICSSSAVESFKPKKK